MVFPCTEARVTVKTGDLTRIEDLIPVRGYLSQIDPRLNFGLGSYSEADVTVLWPDGSVQEMKNIKSNQILTVIKESR